MKWPRGKYNGQKIVGFEVSLRSRIIGWRDWGIRFWIPDITTCTGDFRVIWLFWNLRLSWEYKEGE